MIRALTFFLTLSSFCLPAGAQTAPRNSIVARTGPPVLLDGGGVSFAMSEKEYTAVSKRLAKMSAFVGIKRKPADLTPEALYGFNLVLQGKNVSWILDGNKTRGYVLYADFNGDGDLTNDRPAVFKQADGKYTYTLVKSLTETVNNRKRKYPYHLKLEVSERVPDGKTDPQTILNVQDSTVRRGELRIEGRRVKFELCGGNGVYNDESNSLYFDLDGDGKLDTETRYSLEAFKVKERFVNIGDKTYEFAVDRFGDRLTLKPLAQKLPDRADLRVGSMAPDFEFKDLDGNPRRLSDFRGKVVLLDVWGLWCAPCVAEAPRLAAVYKKIKGKGFEVVSLDKGDTLENLKKFIEENQMSWTHAQADEAFISLYRIDRYPTYFLLDKQGRIISNTMRAGDEMYNTVEKMLGN